jgi:hypothetical protein
MGPLWRAGHRANSTLGAILVMLRGIKTKARDLDVAVSHAAYVGLSETKRQSQI